MEEDDEDQVEVEREEGEVKERRSWMKWRLALRQNGTRTLC